MEITAINSVTAPFQSLSTNKAGNESVPPTIKPETAAGTGNGGTAELSNALQKMASVMNTMPHNAIAFDIDPGSGATVIKVIDTRTNETLGQFPSETALKIAQSIDELQAGQLKGLLLDGVA